MAVLDKLFWSDVIAIWLDRPSDNLRAHVEGRVNPPWWSAAKAVESLVDLKDMTGLAITTHLQLPSIRGIQVTAAVGWVWNPLLISLQQVTLINEYADP